jgi:hypothetical protein
MATRKKAKTTPKSSVVLLEERLPKTLREYSRSVRKELSRIERDVEKVTAAARKRAIKLLREASVELGRLEERGEQAWLRISTPYRRRAAALLSQLEKAVAPPAKARRKAAKKKVTKRKVAKSVAKRKPASRKKVAKRKTTKKKAAKR